MKVGVDRLEGIRELKGKGVGAGLCDDVIGANIFSESFFKGQVVWKCLALTNTLSLILKSGAGDQCLSAETWYHFLTVRDR